ncbi:MAG: IS66 family insertion sequence element accessory protein TnpB [Nannocystaceae bacterium]
MIPPSVRIFVCPEPQDMRRSFDGLALAARQVLGIDPQSGVLICFVNKRRNRLKVLWWDRNGYCLLYKRLHRAVFELPPGEGRPSLKIDGRQLAALVAGVDRPARIKCTKT